MKFGELLDKILSYEIALEECYAAMRDMSEYDGVRLLVFFLGRSRRRIESIVNERSADELSEIRDEQFSSAPESDLQKMLKLYAPAPDKVDSAQLKAFADKMDSLCVEYYKEIILLSDNEKIDRLMDSLIDFKQQERMSLQKMATVDH